MTTTCDLRAEVESLRAVLRDLEWSALDINEDPNFCPSCWGNRDKPTREGVWSAEQGAVVWTEFAPGHKPGCKLAAVLR